MKNKQITIIGIIAITSVLAIIGANVFRQIEKNVEISKLEKRRQLSDLSISYTRQWADSAVIAKPNRELLGLAHVYSDKERGKLYVGNYDSGYYLLIDKIHLSTTKSLAKLVQMEIKSSQQSEGYSYFEFDNEIYWQYKYRGSAPDTTSRFFLSLHGDSINNIVNNDSIVLYHLKCKNLSIKFSKTGPIDIFVEGKDQLFGTYIIPMELLFYKKNDLVYIIIITTKNSKASISHGYLLKQLAI